MSLIAELQRHIDDPALTAAERAVFRCRLTKEFEDAGDYEAARHALGDLWQHVGERPRLDNLDRHTAAEVLLRAGALSGWIGSVRQIDGAQEVAKDLVSESIAVFEELGDTEKGCEGQIDLSICYWREGAFDEARVLIRSVLERIGGRGSQQETRAYLNLAIVEKSANRDNESLRILLDAAPLFEASTSHALKGRYHNQLGLLLRSLGLAERRSDYIDRALVEYAAASFHVSQSGNVRLHAVVENNLSLLFLLNGRYAEAHEHLDLARRLFQSIKDSGSLGSLNDTRARVFLAEGRNAEAERTARSAVRMLEKGDAFPFLAEALTTHGTALARTGQHEEARAALLRAAEIAYQAGDNAGAGLAAMTAIEELSEKLSLDELYSLYERADALLINSQNSSVLNRLRACARLLMSGRPAGLKEFSVPNFVYESNSMDEVLRLAYQVAGSPETILITGEAGTGKEMLARLIHEWSGRTGRFISVDCAALGDTLIESRLFGHRQGSFEDALEERTGAVREAAGGTLLLDNITALSTADQGKLLRLVGQGEIHAIGASVPEHVDVRIIATSTCDLFEQVRAGLFRAELFYRLSTFQLFIQPLRERPEDVPALAAHFIKELTGLHGKRVQFEPEAIEAMRGLRLMGNARELRELIERTVLEADDEALITTSAVETLAARRAKTTSLWHPWQGCAFKEEVLDFEAERVGRALQATRGSVTRAARLLGITHQRLCAMLQSRHKNLLLAKKATRPRKRSIFSRINR